MHGSRLVPAPIQCDSTAPLNELDFHSADTALNPDVDFCATFAVMCVIAAPVLERRRADVRKETTFGFDVDVRVPGNGEADLADANFDGGVGMRHTEIAGEVEFGVA